MPLYASCGSKHANINITDRYSPANTTFRRLYIYVLYIYTCTHTHTHTRTICTCIFTERFRALQRDERTCILKSGRCVSAFMRKDTVSWVYRCGRMRSKMFRKYRHSDKNKSVDFISITLHRSWSWNIERLHAISQIYIFERAPFCKRNNDFFTSLNELLLNRIKLN